jgi:3-oxoacyl-[acyl-carrier protein] reductase
VNLELTGRIALVTGGGRGIGRAIALELARAGADVAICGRTPDALEAVAAEIRATGRRAVAVQADLGDPLDCVRVVESTVAALGALDIFVSNASPNVSSHPSSIEYATDEQILERIQIKSMGTARCVRAALPALRASDQARVIRIGGVSARFVTTSDSMSIGLGNANLVYLAKRLSAELAGDGITVNVIHPGETRTDRFPARIAALAAQLGVSLEEAERVRAARVPIGRIIEPADIAALAVFLASVHASAITGQAIAVDGGATPTTPL